MFSMHVHVLTTRLIPLSLSSCVLMHKRWRPKLGNNPDLPAAAVNQLSHTHSRYSREWRAQTQIFSSAKAPAAFAKIRSYNAIKTLLPRLRLPAQESVCVFAALFLIMKPAVGLMSTSLVRKAPAANLLSPSRHI